MRNNEFGNGWKLDVANAEVTVSHPDLSSAPDRSFENGSRLTFTLPGGQEETFEFQPYLRDVFFGRAINHNVAIQYNNVDPSSRATLEVVNPGSVSQTDLDNDAYHPLNGGEFRITTLAGFIFHISTDVVGQTISARVTKIERDGEVLEIQEPPQTGTSTIFNSNNATVTLHWNNGKITILSSLAFFISSRTDEIEGF